MKINRLLFCSFLLIVSCSFKQPVLLEPPIDFDAEFLNRQIYLFTVEQVFPYKTDSGLTLILRYNTSNRIVFPKDFNLRIFALGDEKWIELKEWPTVRNWDQIVLTPEDPSSSFRMVSFSPFFPNPRSKYNLRVYVFGDMTTENGIMKVGAFIDFVVSPE